MNQSRGVFGNWAPYGLSSTAYHSLLIIDGSVYSWGCNVSGQLGNGTTIDSTVPQKIDTLSNVVAVAWGEHNSMALTQDGNVYMWGYNGFGQLGDGTNIDSKVPKKLNDLSDICMIACSHNHFAMALTSNGDVYSWGNNDAGQLGHGTTNLLTPQKIPNLSNIISIACGFQHSVALTKDGNLISWGGSYYGQLGNGSNIPSKVLQKITKLSNVTTIACSDNHVLVLIADGDVYSWGYNEHGELGIGTTTNSSIPQKIVNLTNIEAIACGYRHSMALSKDGSVYSWGFNCRGQLGIDSTTDSIIPQKINTLGNVSTIACVGNHSMALTKQGHLYTWGQNYNGQLGDGRNTMMTTPQQISLPPGTLQWLRPPSSPATPMFPSLDPNLLSHMERLSNNINSPYNFESDSHQYHTLTSNQVQFHIHKAMLAVRAPGLLNLERLNISPPFFQEIVKFIYTNHPLNFENMKPTEILHIIHFCKSVKLVDLIPSCKEALVPSLTKKNVFDAACECNLLKLSDELNRIMWFIWKHKLSPPPQFSNLSLLTKLMPIYAKKLMTPQLTSRSQLRPLDEVMAVLYSTKVHSDFTINFKNTFIEVHKFVLASRWPYFTNIMLKDQSLTVHSCPMPLDTFTKFIQFFYVGVKHLTLRDCGWILHLSEFYLLHDEKPLLKYCDQMVNAQIQHLPSAFQLAMEIDHKQIEQKAISMIPTTTKPKIVVSMCMGFVKGQRQRIIQEQQKTVQEQRKVLNEIESNLSKIESLLLNTGSTSENKH